MKSPTSIVYTSVRSFLMYSLILLATMFVFLAVAPALFDVEQFRPLIQRLASEELNAKVSLGKLKLNFLGGLSISAESVEVDSFDGERIAEVESILFKLNFLSMLKGSPHTLIKLTNPTIQIERNGSHDLKILKLIRKREKNTEIETTNVTSGEFRSGLLAWLMSWRLKLVISNLVFIVDENKPDVAPKKIGAYEIEVDGLSKTEQSTFKVDQNSGGTDGENAVEIAAEGTLTPGRDEQDQKFVKLMWSSRISAKPKSFLKSLLLTETLDVQTKGEALIFPQELLLQNCQAQVMGTEFTLNGSISGLENLKPQLKITAHSKPIDLSTARTIVYLPDGLSLKGRLDIGTELTGNMESGLKYFTEINAQAITLSHSVFIVSPVIEVYSKISNLSLEQFKVRMEGPDSDLSLSAEVPDFSKPRAKVDVFSTGFNAAKLLNLDAFKGYLKEFGLWVLKFDENLKTDFSLDLKRILYGPLAFENLKTNQKSIRSLLLYLTKAIDRAEKHRQLSEISKSRNRPEQIKRKIDTSPGKKVAPEADKDDVLKKYGF